MAAAIRDDRVSVEVRLETGHDWVAKLRAVWRPGDTLVCYAGAEWGTEQGPLDQILRSRLQAPVYVLPAGTNGQASRPKLASEAISWAGSAGVLVAFFFLQVRIVEWLHDWVQTALLAGSVIFEIALVWIWDSLTT